MNRDDDPDTSVAFADALSELVLAAVDNEVPVEGGWAVEDPDTDGRWSVEVTRVRGDE